MFNVGGGQLLVILAVALIVLGPQKLPEAARTVGRVFRELQRMSSGFQREFQRALDDSDSDAEHEVASRIKPVPEAMPLASVIRGLDGPDDDAVDDGPSRDGLLADADTAVERALDEIVSSYPPLGPATEGNGSNGADAPTDSDRHEDPGARSPEP